MPQYPPSIGAALTPEDKQLYDIIRRMPRNEFQDWQQGEAKADALRKRDPSLGLVGVNRGLYQGTARQMFYDLPQILERIMAETPSTNIEDRRRRIDR